MTPTIDLRFLVRAKNRSEPHPIDIKYRLVQARQTLDWYLEKHRLHHGAFLALLQGEFGRKIRDLAELTRGELVQAQQLAATLASERSQSLIGSNWPLEA